MINTHRMICSNQQMILQTLPFLGDEPPVLVDWLPWHHTFGGNHNVGIVVYNGGTLYLDEGRPMPGAFDESVRNLREVAPTIYLNVPKGYEELVRAFRQDRALAATFFGRVQVLFYAAAGLSQHVADELQEIAVETCGERLVLVTGLGATETAPMAICRPWASELSSAIGLPVPGVDVKLAVPSCGRCEARDPRPRAERDAGVLAAGRPDARGVRRRGLLLHGRRGPSCRSRDLSKGLVFDGRIKEDFKLSTGTWVSVGPLRARVITHFAPYVRDVVIAGHDRDEVGMLIVPDVEACRTLCPDLPAGAPASAVVGHAGVRERLGALLDDLRRRRHGQCDETGAGHRARRAAVARRRGSDRQGVAQSARDPRPAPHRSSTTCTPRTPPSHVISCAVAPVPTLRNVGEQSMNVDDLTAIDVHVHLEHDASRRTRTKPRGSTSGEAWPRTAPRPWRTTTARARWGASCSRSTST